MINTSLKNGYVDYVLVYPAPGNDQFKTRQPLSIRQGLINTVYSDHPKVLLTDWSPKKLQETFLPFLSQLSIIGVIGSDMILEKFMDPKLGEEYHQLFMRGTPIPKSHNNDAIGALMALPTDSFIIALRNGEDPSYLSKQLNDRSIAAVIPSFEMSSSQVREVIASKKPFDKMVSDPVAKKIKQDYDNEVRSIHRNYDTLKSHKLHVVLNINFLFVK